MGESENIQHDEYEYLTDLTFRDRIFYLDYRHTSIVIQKGLGNGVNLKQHCVFLDFSGSKIGDEGACLISKVSSESSLFQKFLILATNLNILRFFD